LPDSEKQIGLHQVLQLHASELFLERAQVQFLGPGRWVLLMQLPINVGNGCRQKHAM